MGRREDNKRRKREALLAAGMTQFTAEGYERATIEQIVREAGVARGTFYLYYPDKLALFRDLITPWIDELLELSNEIDAALQEATDPAEALEIYEHMGVGIALLGLNHRDGVLLAFRESRRAGEVGDFLRGEEQRIVDALTEVTARANAKGLITVTDPRLNVLIIFGAVERLYFEVLTGTDLGDPSEIATEVVRVFGLSMGMTPA